MRLPDWFCADSVFRKYDLNSISGATDFSRIMWRLYQDLDLGSIRKEVEQQICLAKRRYGKSQKCWPPFGYYFSSDARVLASRSIERGGLFKRAIKPSYIYDYNNKGDIARICQMWPDGKRIHMISHCVQEGLLELRICAQQNKIDDISQAQYQYDSQKTEGLALILHKKDGNLAYSIYTTFCDMSGSCSAVTSEVEMYGDIIGLQQGMRKYYFFSESNDIWCHAPVYTDYLIRYNTSGKMVEAGTI